MASRANLRTCAGVILGQLSRRFRVDCRLTGSYEVVGVKSPLRSLRTAVPTGTLGCTSSAPRQRLQQHRTAKASAQRMPIGGPARQRARELANTPEFAQAQRQRKKVEALFAELKNQIGLRRLRLRRLRFVREQFFLAAAAQNIKRLVRFLSQPTTPVLPATT